MKRLNRRRFVAFATVGVAGTALTACGGDKTTSTNLQPTRIPDVAGAPTLASQATPPNVSADGGAGAGGNAGGGEAATSAEIHTEDIKFDKTELTIAADTDVKITVTNKGVLQHDFHVDKLDITSKILNGGESDTVTVNAKAGEYDYWCTIPGHKEAGMVGKLHVVVAGAAAAPAEGAPAAEAAATEVTVTSSELKFEPKDFTIAADTDVTIDFKNAGALEHDMHIEAPTAFTSDMLKSGGEQKFTLNLPAGTYEFWCTVPGHKEAGMDGKITVVAAGAAPTGGAASPEAGASPAASPAGGAPAAPASSAATTAEIHTVDIGFDPKELTVAANTDVKITVTNKGVLQHDFHVDKLNVTSKMLNGGDSDTVTINAAPGTYDFWCTVPGHKEAGMVGKLIVQ